MTKRIIILFNIFGLVYCCTIGGAYDNEGRPYLFKVRDKESYNENQLHYNISGDYPYIGIINVASNLIDGRTLGGINSAGLAIVNAVLNTDEDIDTDHGEFMHAVLSNHDSITGDLDASLQIYIETFELNANFILISGEYLWLLEKNNDGEYEFELVEDLYQCRSNFLISDVNTDQEYAVHRQEYCENVLVGIAGTNNLNEINILNSMLRSFKKSTGAIYPIPYPNQVLGAGSPNGYIDTRYSVNRDNNVSTLLFRGAMAGEDIIGTMWTILGNASSGIAVPVWPIGELPYVLTGNSGNQAPMEYINHQIKDRLFSWENQDDNGTTREEDFIDSYQLINESENGLWPDYIFPVESIVINDALNMIELWNSEGIDLNGMMQYQQSVANFVYNQMTQISTDKPPIICDFEYAEDVDDEDAEDGDLGNKFKDRSLHAPVSWEWEIDNNIFNEQNLKYFYFNGQTDYEITLTVGDSENNTSECSQTISCSNCFWLGDVNQDDLLTVVDITSIVYFIIGDLEFTSYQEYLGDLNEDEVINILDIIILVNMIIDVEYLILNMH